MGFTKTERKIPKHGNENKNHHEHISKTLNSKREKSIVKKIKTLFEKKKIEVDIVSNPGKTYQALLREDIGPKTPLCLFKVLFETKDKEKPCFSVYSLENGWYETEDATITSLATAIKYHEGVKV